MAWLFILISAAINIALGYGLAIYLRRNYVGATEGTSASLVPTIPDDEIVIAGEEEEASNEVANVAVPESRDDAA